MCSGFERFGGSCVYGCVYIIRVYRIIMGIGDGFCVYIRIGELS